MAEYTTINRILRLPRNGMKVTIVHKPFWNPLFENDTQSNLIFPARQMNRPRPCARAGWI